MYSLHVDVKGKLTFLLFSVEIFKNTKMAGDQEKEVEKKFLKNGHQSQLTEEAYRRELNQMRNYFIGLLAIVIVTFLILIISFSILFANIKYDVAHHSHPPKVGEKMRKILEKEKLCLQCDHVRLGPSLEEDRALDYFVREPATETEPEQCCVETPSQLLKMLQFVSIQAQHSVVLNTFIFKHFVNWKLKAYIDKP